MLLTLFASLSLSFASHPLFEMTLEEKVGQLLMVQFTGELANEEARVLIQDTHVGGIIYYNWSNGLHSPKQVQSLSLSLQELTNGNPHPIPLFIAIDQEGGAISRLQQGFSHFPGNAVVGNTGNPQLAKEIAFTVGNELRAVGINMNLAPVVDVNSNPQNLVIGARSFSDQPQIVAAFGEQALQGYREAHVLATLKHFPGHGDTTVDSHADLPIVHKSLSELKKVELLPFSQLASSAEAIMTAHILIPAFDTENCSTLSEKTLRYLREIIGFQGLIVSDSLIMEGVLKQCGTVEEAAIQTLQAGCDLLILGGKLLIGEKRGFELRLSDIQRIHRALIEAVQSGRITEARVDQAVEKILNLKERYK